MVKEKENNVLTLVRAGGDALDVELLHDDKQDGDGDRHQHTACTEKCKVVVDQGLLQHIIQTDSHCPVGRDARIQDHFCHHEIGPWNHERADDGIDQDRLGHGQNDLKEHTCVGCAVQLGGFPQGDGDGIKEALADQIAQTGRTGIDHDKTGIGVGQIQIFQDEIDGDHCQHAGEQVDADRKVLDQLAPLEAAAAQRVGYHQHKAGGDNAVETGHHKGVGKPARELRHRVRVEQNVDIVAQCITGREEPPHIDAPVCGEGSDQKPQNGYQPDSCQQGQQQMPQDAADCAEDTPAAQLRCGLCPACRRNSCLCQENVASFLLRNRKHTSVNTAQMMNTIMPMTAAIL